MHLRRVEEAFHVLIEAKDGRALLGFVAPEALENRRAIVNDVG
jgi:hypothetical protein